MTGENAVSQVANPPGSVATNGKVAPNDLRAPVRETPEKLVAAIQSGALWQHLTDFQTIADRHPDAQGTAIGIPHSRYKASVNYVANLMRRPAIPSPFKRIPFAHLRSLAFPRLFGWPRLSCRKGLGDGKAIQRRKRHRPRSAGDWLSHGCSAEEFANFRRGDIAMLQRGECAYDAQVANAEYAGASAIILYDPQSQPRARGQEDRAIEAAGCNAPVCIARQRFQSSLSHLPQWRPTFSADRRRRVSHCASQDPHPDPEWGGLQRDC